MPSGNGKPGASVRRIVRPHRRTNHESCADPRPSSLPRDGPAGRNLTVGRPNDRCCPPARRAFHRMCALTTPARRRPFCSFASLVPPCARVPRLRPPCCRCWLRLPACFPPTPAVPKRAKRFSNSVHRLCLGLRRAPWLRSRQRTSCWSLRPAPVCSPFSQSFRAHRSFSTSFPKPARSAEMLVEQSG